MTMKTLLTLVLVVLGSVACTDAAISCASWCDANCSSGLKTCEQQEFTCKCSTNGGAVAGLVIAIVAVLCCCCYREKIQKMCADDEEDNSSSTQLTDIATAASRANDLDLIRQLENGELRKMDPELIKQVSEDDLELSLQDKLILRKLKEQ
eukprot:TRINITY_DN68103_c2_g3_i1.p1 TRINITY_DN68103_c2_g3~~TRINITY_DN68103_c2_g3_i1.p1  ORF type:complete len:151 (-),score=22.49 TRINITY_DN68103_c2_g3_i1:100-552(-)